MSRREVMVTRIGEMWDLISCLSIYEGKAEPARAKITRFEDAIKLR